MKVDTAPEGTRLPEVELAHAVPGRLRLAIPAIRRRPDLAARIAARLSKERGILKVRARAVTGSIIVTFDSRLDQTGVIDLARQATIAPESAAAPLAAEKPAGSQTAATNWHAGTSDALIARLDSSRQRGLNPTDAARRLAVYGPNRTTRAEPPPRWQLFARQLESVPVMLLLGSAGLSLASGALAEAVTTMTVVGANAVLGYKTESDAERTIHRLVEGASEFVTVMRGGRRVQIDAVDVVPGDKLALQPGTHICADARLISAANLLIDESALTGESVPVAKELDEARPAATPLGDRTNMVHAGSLVAAGSGWGIVVATGMETEAARIQNLTETEARPKARLERELDEIGAKLAGISVVACGLFFVTGAVRGYPLLTMLRDAAALAVAAVPEGLPTVATTTLARGLKRMQERNILIRRIDVVENLGAMHTLCLDKTGTLTCNDMAVVEIVAGGRSYLPEGFGAGDASLARLLEVAALNTEVAPDNDGDAGVKTPSATERGLRAAAVAGGADVDGLKAAFPIQRLIERRAGRRFVVTLHGGGRLTVKGSPEDVLARCTTTTEGGIVRELTDTDRDSILADNDHMSGRPARVLGFAERREAGDVDGEDLQGLTWLGLAAMVDPIRPGAREFIADLHGAGIETVLITGDQAATAQAVARDLDLSGGAPIQVVDSANLAAIEPKLLAALAARTHVFARVSPEQKLVIVRALQESGRVVGMIGDGVNDGPALKAADVGIAMGASGTNLARDVANVLIADDRLPTLLEAIAQGRTVHRSIRRALEYLITTNLSEIVVEIVEAMHNPNEVESALELLWINLVTDILPGLGLALADADASVMALPPRPRGTPIIPPQDARRIGADGMIIAASALGTHFFALGRHGPGPRTRAMTFNTLVLSQLLYTFACQRIGVAPGRSVKLLRDRTLDLSLLGAAGLQALPYLVPPLRRLMGVAPVSLGELALSFGAASLPVSVAVLRSPDRFAEIVMMGRKPDA